MKTTHTPGPWETFFDGHGGMTIEAKERQIGYVSGGPEQQANAKLIAAAPNLAAKLADLIQYLGEDWNGDSMVEECKQALQEAGQPFEYEANDNETDHWI